MPAPAVDAKLALEVVYIAPVPAVSMASAPDVDAAPGPVAGYVSEVYHAVFAVDAVDEDDAVDAVDEDEAVDAVDVVGTASTQPTPLKQPAVIAATAPVVEYVTAATAVFAAPAMVAGRSAPAPAVISGVAPLVKFFAPVPDRSTCAIGGGDGAASKGASSCGGPPLQFRRPRLTR